MTRLAVSSLTLATLVATAAAVTAQGRHVFVADQAASAFTYTGSATYQGLGPAPIQGVPNNMFNLKGTFDADLTVSGGTVTSGAFVPGGSATTVPQLSAILPSGIPFVPPLATIDITGLQIVFTSVNPITLAPASFAVVGGNFSTDVAATLAAGSAAITPLTGGTTIINLAGSSAPPQFVTGTITSTATGFHVSVPISLSFSFSDAPSSTTGVLALTGPVEADYRLLNSDSDTMSIAAGGTQTLFLSSGGALPLNPYLVVGSASGTSPGLPIGPGQVLPLNFDPVLTYSLDNANNPPFFNTFNTLDANGKSTAGFTLPPAALNPALAGNTIHWAYVVIDLGAGAAIGLISNPEPLLLTP